MHTTKILKTAFVLILLCTTTYAQTWDGGGGDDNFTTADNWNPNGAPVNNGTANLVFDGNVRTSPIVNIDFDVNSVTFNSTASIFRLLGTSTLSIREGGIVNDANFVHFFNIPVSFSSVAISSIVSVGALEFNGPLTLPTTTLTIDGIFTNIEGPIVGLSLIHI